MKRSLVLLAMMFFVAACGGKPVQLQPISAPSPHAPPMMSGFDIDYSFVGFVGAKAHLQSYYLSARVVPGEKFYEEQRARDYLFQLFEDVRETCPSGSRGWDSSIAWISGSGEISDNCWDLLRSETGMRPATRISDKLLKQLVKLENALEGEGIDSFNKSKVLVTDKGQVLGMVDSPPESWNDPCAKEMLKWAGWYGGRIISIYTSARIDDDDVYKHLAEEGTSPLMNEWIPNFCQESGLIQTDRPDWVQSLQVEMREYNLTITDSNGRVVDAKFTVGEDGRILVEAGIMAFEVGRTNPIMLWARQAEGHGHKFVYVMFSESGDMMWYDSLGGEGFKGPRAVIISPELDGVVPFVSGFKEPAPYYLIETGEVVEPPHIKGQQG